MLFLPCNPSGQVFLVTIYIWLNTELYQDWQTGLRDNQVHKCGQMDSWMKRQTLDQSHSFSSHCQPMAGELKTKIDFFSVTQISPTKLYTQSFVILFHISCIFFSTFVSRATGEI